MALFVPETWPKSSGFDWSDIRGTKQRILDEHFPDWSDGVKKLVTESRLSGMRLWPFYDTPKPSDGGRWETDLGVTLIADAAHVMPPWSGRGAK